VINLVLCDKHDGVALLTLSRPRQLDVPSAADALTLIVQPASRPAEFHRQPLSEPGMRLAPPEAASMDERRMACVVQPRGPVYFSSADHNSRPSLSFHTL
jgi:hypothetical protein